MEVSEVLQGKQLVVRMQYDDSINVTQSYMDQVLTSIYKALNNSEENRDLSEFDIILGARVNSAPTTDQGAQKENTSGQHTVAIRSNVTDLSGPNLLHKTMGGCGLSSLVSSPTENYAFYAKTAMRDSPSDSGTRISTILVEVFVNGEISDKQTRGVVILAITKAIDSYIINQPENKGSDIRICVLNFLTSAYTK